MVVVVLADGKGTVLRGSCESAAVVGSGETMESPELGLSGTRRGALESMIESRTNTHLFITSVSFSA